MLQEIDHEIDLKTSSGIALKHLHKMGKDQWDYNNDLADRSGIPRIPQAVIRLYNDVHDRRTHLLMKYKEDDFQMDLQTGFYKLKQ